MLTIWPTPNPPPCWPPKACPPPPPWPPRAYAGAPLTRSNAAISAVSRLLVATSQIIQVEGRQDGLGRGAVEALAVAEWPALVGLA